MKTIVKNLDKGTYGMTANMKKLVLNVIGMNNPEYFGRKIKANKTNMTIEPTGDNTYRVTEHLNRPSLISGGTYEKTFTYNIEVVTK
jgi:hypothetical protein